MVLISPYTSVYDNLAFEDLLFSSYRGEGRILLLYINDPSVVIGRFQNPWAEADLRALKEHRCSIARRISGGGTVYHDRGNLNYSLFTSRSEFDKNENAAAIAGALSKMGIDVDVNERQDLLLDGRKISGSAFRICRTKAYHHGTLLVEADLSKVRSFLRPSYPGIRSKAVKSVSAAVTNICEEYPGISIADVITALSRERRCAGDDAEYVLPGTSEVSDRSRELASTAWIFGKTPAFSLEYRGTIAEFPAGSLPLEDEFSLPI